MIDSDSQFLSGRISGAVGRLVEAYSLPIIGVTAIVTLFFVVSLRSFRVENSPDQLALPKDDPCGVELQEFEDRFQTGKTTIVGMECDRKLAGQELRDVLAMTQRLDSVEGVTGVQSLSTAFHLYWKWSAGMYELRPRIWFPAAVRNNDTSAAAAVRDLIAHPLYEGNLISQNGRNTALVLAVKTEDSLGAKSVARLRAIFDNVRTAVVPYETEGRRFHYAGTPLVTLELHDALRKDLRLFAPLSILLLLVTFAVVLRAALPVMLGCAVAVMALIWTLGILSVTGTPMSLSLSIIVPLIPALTLVYSMHYLTAVLYRPRDTHGFTQTPAQAMSHVYVPSWLCGLTTAAGFVTLSFSPLRGIREVGIYLAAGVMACTFLVNVFLPALICRLNMGPAKRQTNRHLAIIVVQALYRTTAKHPVAIMVGAVFVVILLAAGMLGLRVETNHLEYLPADNPLRRAFSFVDQNFGGVLPIEVVVTFPPDESAAVIPAINAFTTQLRGLTNMGAVVSVADLLTEADRIRPDPDAYYSPDIDLKGGRISKDVWQPITESRAGGAYVKISDSLITWRIGCRAHIGTSRQLDRLLRDVERLADTQLRRYSPVVTGLTKYYVRTEDYVVSTQVLSVAIALLVTMTMLGFLAGTRRVSMVAVAVNICPVIAVLGIMGWLRIPVDIATVMIASIAIGIIVDDTIHILYNYRGRIRAGQTPDESLAGVFTTIGVPIVVSTITLSVAFCVLALASFHPTACFGILSALTIFLAAVADLVILPILLARPSTVRSVSGRSDD